MRSLSRIVEELVPEYLAARNADVSEMVELLAASDFARLQVLSHSLKGSGGSFGFAELSRWGATLERHAAQANRVAFGEELFKLKDYLEHLHPPASSRMDT